MTEQAWLSQVSLNVLFGRILVALRQEKGLTQRQFGRLSKMKPGAIQRLETGRATLSVAHVVKAARAFKAPDLLPLDDGEAIDLELSSFDLLALLFKCSRHLRQLCHRVYLEGPAWDDLEELEPPRIDRLIAPVIEAYLVVEE